MHIDRRTGLFLWLLGIFVTCLVVGDIVGGKLTEVTLWGRSYIVSIGMIPFPVTFVLTDVLNEFYGKQVARRVTWIGFGMAGLAFVLLAVAVQVPWAGMTRASDWTGMNQPSFDNVFSGSQRILGASMVAYLAGQFADIAVFHALRGLTSGRLLWLRATGSTVVSQLIDTVVIQTIAWWGILPPAEIFGVAVNSYVIKVLVAVGLTPVIYAAHVAVERGLGIVPAPVVGAEPVREIAPGTDGSTSARD